MQIQLLKFRLSVNLPDGGEMVDPKTYESSDIAPYMLFTYVLPSCTVTATRVKLELMDDVKELVNQNLKDIKSKGYKVDLLQKLSLEDVYYVLLEDEKNKALQVYFEFNEHIYSATVTADKGYSLSKNKVEESEPYKILVDIVHSIKSV